MREISKHTLTYPYPLTYRAWSKQHNRNLMDIDVEVRATLQTAYVPYLRTDSIKVVGRSAIVVEVTALRRKVGV